MTVSGRFDDTDIVHVFGENLLIQGTPGGLLLEPQPPTIGLITQTPIAGGTLLAGTYNYRLTFVDIQGNEGPVSDATPNVTATTATRSIRLAQLPVVAGDFVARNLYRSRPDGTYELVTQLNGTSTSYVDNGTTRGGALVHPRANAPRVPQVTLTPLIGGGTLAAGTYNYRVTFIDVLGNEGPASERTPNVTVGGTAQSIQRSVQLAQLPIATGSNVARNLYRLRPSGDYILVARLDGTSTTYLDDGTTQGALLNDTGVSLRPRFDARLSVDPSIVVKLDGARIETGIGAQFIAEGREGLEIKFTSLLDDRYGAGGTFDTANDGVSSPGSNNEATPGDWGGIMLAEYSSGNIDHALFAYGGGVTRVKAPSMPSTCWRSIRPRHASQTRSLKTTPEASEAKVPRRIQDDLVVGLTRRAPFTSVARSRSSSTISFATTRPPRSIST